MPRRSCSAARRAPTTTTGRACGSSWTGSSGSRCQSGKPLLGICLGAQMMARVLGARVGRHPENLVEIGYHPIYPTAAGAAYFDGPTMFYQWHKETFEIPRGAVHLAHNDAFDVADVPLWRARLRHRVPPRDDARHDRALVGLGAGRGDALAARRPAARGSSSRATGATARRPTAGSRASSIEHLPAARGRRAARPGLSGRRRCRVGLVSRAEPVAGDCPRGRALRHRPRSRDRSASAARPAPRGPLRSGRPEPGTPRTGSAPNRRPRRDARPAPGDRAP